MSNAVQVMDKQQQVRPYESPQFVPVDIGYSTSAGFNQLQRIAQMFSKCSFLPKNYAGNFSNCVIAINLANRINADPLMVMQNLYVVNGNPGFSSKFLIACFNATGKFSALRFETTGDKGTDTWGCRAIATELKTGEKLVGPEITIDMAKKEGWYSKNGSKWQTMPEIMLKYRAASTFIKLYAPEISMGMSTTDELADIVETQATDDGTIVMVEPESERNKQ